jgi:RNA polymerase sigma-70 factor, ECF subfamily
MKGRQNTEKAQLSGEPGVDSDVASMALKTDGISASLEQKFPARGARTASLANKATALKPGVALDELSDAEVMLRVGAGDDAAFDHLVEKFRRPVVSFMYRMAHNQAVAEELAQEVFLRVYRSRQTYAAEAKFTTWLYRIATNLAVNHARDTKSERTAPSVSLDEPDQETGSRPDVPDKGLTAEQQLLRNERMAAIKQHVMELPERQRMAVLMHKYQEMDYREIAQVLKLSESATKSLLFRAYETLREKLKGFV